MWKMYRSFKCIARCDHGACARRGNNSPYEKQQQSLEQGESDASLKSKLSSLCNSPNPRPTAATSTEALYIDGAEPMNLASQSGDAGGSQLLFANFNQDNT